MHWLDVKLVSAPRVERPPRQAISALLLRQFEHVSLTWATGRS